MSCVGDPYDNTLILERMNHFSYKTREGFDAAVNEFTYAWYNRVRSHRYINRKTPAQARDA